jgi:hypothetical protein
MERSFTTHLKAAIGIYAKGWLTVPYNPSHVNNEKVNNIKKIPS